MINFRALIFFLLTSFCIVAEQRNLVVILDPLYMDSNNSSVNFIGTQVDLWIKTGKAIILTDVSSWACYLSKLKGESFVDNEWCFYQKGNYVLLVPNLYKSEDGSCSGLNISDFKLIKKPKNNIAYIRDFEKNKIFKFFLHQSFAAYCGKLAWSSRTFNNCFEKLMTCQKLCSEINWNIFAVGHGSPVYLTCGMTESAFRRLLDFLENKINTRVFCYSSCYSSGMLSDYIYSCGGSPKKYSFPIMVQGIQDGVSIVDTNTNFQSFIDKVELLDLSDEDSVNELANELYSIDGSGLLDAIVSFRLAGSDKFVYQNMPEKIIFDTESNDLEAEESNIDGHVIALPFINDTLVINHRARIISGISGEACHFIEKIETDMSHIDLLALFSKNSSITELVAKKIFIADEAEFTSYSGEKYTVKNLMISVFNSSERYSKMFFINEYGKAIFITMDHISVDSSYKLEFHHENLSEDRIEKCLDYFNKTKESIKSNNFSKTNSFYDPKKRKTYLLRGVSREFLSNGLSWGLSSRFYRFLNPSISDKSFVNIVKEGCCAFPAFICINDKINSIFDRFDLL